MIAGAAATVTNFARIRVYTHLRRHFASSWFRSMVRKYAQLSNCSVTTYRRSTHLPLARFVRGLKKPMELSGVSTEAKVNRLPTSTGLRETDVSCEPPNQVVAADVALAALGTTQQNVRQTHRAAETVSKDLRRSEAFQRTGVKRYLERRAVGFAPSARLPAHCLATRCEL
jgi:hypothetical protein